MADIDLKTLTPDTSLPTTGFLFGADSQATASPSVYGVTTAITTILGNAASSDALVFNSDTTFSRGAIRNFRFGEADAATALAQTLSVQSVVAGTSNAAGAAFTITGSQGTGTGAGGSLIFQVAPAGTAGTAQNALAPALTINSAGKATFAPTVNSTNSFEITNLAAQTIASVDSTNRRFNMGGASGGSIFSVSGATGGSTCYNTGYFGWTSSGSADSATVDARLYRDAAGVIGVRGTSTTVGAALSFIEQTAPASPAANIVRIYAEDNGLGKTRLMVLFATGAAIPLATEL